MIKDPEQRATIIRWVAGYIAKQGSELAWVTTHSEPIVKASLNFLAKVW